MDEDEEVNGVDGQSFVLGEEVEVVVVGHVGVDRLLEKKKNMIKQNVNVKNWIVFV